jgi:hypothetical protein
MVDDEWIFADVIYMADCCEHDKSRRGMACIACVEAGLQERESRLAAAEAVCEAIDEEFSGRTHSPALEYENRMILLAALAAWRKGRE